MATVPEGYVALDFVGFTDKGTYSPDATYMQNDLVHLDNSIWKCRVDQTTGILPGDNDNWEIFINSTSELKGTTANDVNGLLGTAGAKVDAQMLIDAITDRVVNQLLAKPQLVANLLATEPGNPLDATMGKVLKDETDSLNNVFTQSMDLLNKKLTDTDYISVVKGDKFAAGGALYCWVRNGFACITMEVTPKEAVANGDIVLYALPKPRTNIYCTLGGTQGNYNARINADTGNLVIYYPKFTEVMRIDTFIVYPVA